MDHSDGVQRKLTAILSADVKGYSRLMSDDEAATVRTITAYRTLMATLVAQHRGRVVDATGDNVLAEFASVVDAVQGAVAIQRELRIRNAELPDHRRMEFRIGINLGDVIVEGDRIYGDGVNIAARIQGLAEGGGICLSGTAYDQVKNKLALGYDPLGEHAVKNIVDPVRAYRARLGPGPPAPRPTRAETSRPRRWAPVALVTVLIVGVGAVAIWRTLLRPAAPPAEVASEAKMAFPLPEQPSIAVLPFDNLSGDPGQAYLADGLTEDIITTLSQLRGLFVIARNSTFVYRGKAVKVQRVAEDLGVRYVLEGSVQRSGETVRVSAQLIDALTGHHLWARRYDRDLRDLFAVQDEITHEIATALQVKLSEGEQARVWRRHTRNMDAWAHMGRGTEHFDRLTREGNALARQFYERAVAVDPEYGLAYSLLAWTHWQDAFHGWSESRARSIARAAELAQKARSVDESLPDVYALLGAIHLIKGEYDEAVALGNKAVALNPNHSNNTALLAMTLGSTGQPEAAVRALKRAMRLSPYYPPWYLELLGFEYVDAAQPEPALAAFASFLERKPSAVHAAHAHLGRAQAYHALGREPEARAAVATALELDPGLSARSMALHSLDKDKAAAARSLAILRGLGLPE